MKTPETAPVPGTSIWSCTESLVRAKSILFLISGIMFVIAVEAIRVAVVAGTTGRTPLAFGLMPTRSLVGNDIAIVIGIALLGIAWVGYRMVRVVFEGMPLAIGLVGAAAGTAAGLAIAWDGLLKPVRFFPFTVIQEIDSISRGTMGGGGHQVRLRITGRRIAVTIARFETAVDADGLVRDLIEARETALGE